MQFSRLRGFKDIYGSDAQGFAGAERIAREVFGSFGFQEIRTPVLEEKELFTRALGSETDVVQKEMYEFLDRSKTAVALRPEGTAGVVRAYLENNFDKTEGLAKFYYSGPMFRAERPQAGRLRQFHQIGVETLGTDSPYADAEAIHCLTVFLDKAGAAGYRLRLNNLGTFEERAAFRKVLLAYFKPLEKSLCEDCQSRLSKNVFRVLDCKVESCRPLAEKSPAISEHLSAESRAHFDAVCGALKGAGVGFSLDPRMVRGLDYYTQTVFEISHPKLGAQDALAAGGRYGHLIESFGGPKLGAVGFAVGVERLLMCLQDTAAAKEATNVPIFIATLGPAAFQKGFVLLSQLRANGTAAQMDFSAKSLKGQMRAADKAQCRFVVILGDDEIQKGVFVLKDMKDGSQKESDLNQAAQILKSLC